MDVNRITKKLNTPAIEPVGPSANMQSFSDFLSGYLPPELRGIKSERVSAQRKPTQQHESVVRPQSLAADEPYRPGALLNIEA
jgi:hypothetical protein